MLRRGDTGGTPVPRTDKTTIGPPSGQTGDLHMAQDTAPILASRTTPLWAVLSYTFLCSIGSGIVYAGVFFLAKYQYGFNEADNFALGLLYGLTYIPAALSVGSVLRRLGRAGIAPRTLLGIVTTLMGTICFVPWIIELLSSHSSHRATWPIWAIVAIYGPLSGAMWPIVESFLAGGRSEGELRSATGRFNVTWSSAIVLTLLAMAPLLEKHAMLLLNALGVVHLACVGIVACFQKSPAAHEHHEHARPVIYKQLLTFLRLLLPVSFMFISTISPYMPSALERMQIDASWQTAIAAVWPAARVAMFFTLERWHGWHGKWTTPIIGALLLIAAFVFLILVPPIAPAGFGLALFLLGLIGFGIGVGIIYAAALYYAVEVGSSGVDAGGTHEALIGIGYTAGPICGLAGLGAASAGLVAKESANLVMLGLVVVAALGAGTFALAKAARMKRSGT